jgi:gluconate 2-dehydrogenase alpha chain
VTRLPRADVVVVGLGAAGGIAAMRYAQAGLTVVGLEAGPRVSRDDFVFDELANDFHNRLGTKANGEVPTWRPTPDGKATTSRDGRVVRLMANGVGGGTIHYAGQHFRLAPWHFRLRGATAKRYGADALPPDCTATDWPVGYEELEPFYTAVERELGISGGEPAGASSPPTRRDGWGSIPSRARPRSCRSRIAATAPVRTAASATGTAAISTRRARRT